MMKSWEMYEMMNVLGHPGADREIGFRRPKTSGHDVEVYKHRAKRKVKSRLSKASKRGNR